MKGKLIWLSMVLAALVGFILGITAHTCCVDSGHCTDCYWSGETNPIGGGRCEGNLDMEKTKDKCEFGNSWYDLCTDEFGTDCCRIEEYICDKNGDGNVNTCRNRIQVPMANCTKEEKEKVDEVL